MAKSKPPSVAIVCIDREKAVIRAVQDCCALEMSQHREIVGPACQVHGTLRIADHHEAMMSAHISRRISGCYFSFKQTIRGCQLPADQSLDSPVK